MLNSLSGLSGAGGAESPQAAPAKASRTTRRADQLTLIRYIVAVWAFPVQIAPQRLVRPPCTPPKRDRGDAPIPPLTRAKARLARTATPTSSFSVPVPA